MSNSSYLLLAIKDLDYVRFAVNLAISLKANGTKAPIFLLSDGTHNQVDLQGVIDGVIEIEEKGKFLNPFYIKTLLYKYRQSESTIYLDVDAIAFGHMDGIADERLSDGMGDGPGDGMYYFFPHVKGTTYHKDIKSENHHWCNPIKAMEYYGMEVFSSWLWFEINSSLLFFRESDYVEEMFNIAKYLYDTEPYPHYQHEGFWNYPDELPFELAIAMHGGIPAWKPNLIYFHDQNTPWNLSKILKKTREFPIFGLNGAGMTTHKKMWEFYNDRGIRQARATGKEWNRMAMEHKIAYKGRGGGRFTGFFPKLEERPEFITKYLK